MKKFLLKRISVLIIFIILCLCTFSSTTSAKNVGTSSQTLYVDGVQQKLEVYSNNGNSYFKLRDIAYILKDTNSQFEVSFDAKNNMISVATGHIYTVIGGEMKISGAKSSAAVLSNQKLMIDGKKVSIAAYTIGSNNFFDVKELGVAIKFFVDYDSKAKSIIIDTKNEIAHAIQYGIVPSNIQSRYNEIITYSDFCTMLGNVIAHDNVSMKNRWKTVASKALLSNKKMHRDDGMLALFYAAEVANIDTFNCDLGFNNKLSGDDAWNELSFNYPLFPDWKNKKQIGNFTYDNYIVAAYSYSLGRQSLYSGGMVFDRDDNTYSMRVSEGMTRKEGILAAVRLFDSIASDTSEIPLTDVGEKDFSDKTIKAANEMPKPTSQSLPKWHGINLINLDNPGAVLQGLPHVYTENQVELVHEMGFNFVRVPLSPDAVLSEDKLRIKKYCLDNMDKLVEWCAERGIHVCFDIHYNANRKEDGTYNYNIDYIKSFWKMMARHYIKIPSSAVSFNVLNEPFGSDDAIDAMNIAGYQAIRDIDANRLIFCDGIWGNFGKADMNKGAVAGVSKLPSIVLSKYDAAQTFHWYTGVFNGDYWCNSSGYPPQDTWPYPFVSSLVWENSPMIIDGDFYMGEKVNINLSMYNIGENLIIYLDGKEVLRKSLTGEAANIELTLPTDGSSLTIAVDGQNIKVRSIEIIHNELAEKPIPYYKEFWNWFNSDSRILRYEKHLVTNILCEQNTYSDNMVSHITVKKDGTYTAETKSDGAAYTYDYGLKGLASYLKIWSDFKATADVNVMCQEFGFYCTPASQNVQLHWTEDWLTALDNADIPWSSWDWERLVMTYNPKDALKGATWIKTGDFWVNKELLNVYQSHMH